MTDQITVVGNIANDPAPGVLPNGAEVLRFRMATNRRRYDRESGAWVDDPPNWYSVTAYRALAANGAASLSKGQRVVVAGRLRVRSWESDKGTRGTEVEIVADALGGDLLFGTTTFTRTAYASARSADATPPQGAGEGPSSDAGSGSGADDVTAQWATAPLGEDELVSSPY